jgi:hypothetical protein
VTVAIIKYDEACRAVAAARTIDDVREWEDKAAAVREYSRRARNRSMEIDALEIRARARRRRGELLIELKDAGRLVKGNDKVTDQVPNGRLTLDDLGVSKNESSRDQKLAAVDGNSFERLVERCRAYMEANPEKHSFDVLKDGQGPINGARATMGSRQEPDDSLDYFPTPPWATRALMERVLPAHGITMRGGISEPACGEGHIAEVLREYPSLHVMASDIFDGYGYATEIQDYLSDDVSGGCDWTVTNPPFGDAALAFVEKALRESRIGVAMFFRSQWAVEGLERYQRVFKHRPPTICAFFVERVNLCKGRWDPDGSTATAYCWLVWHQGARPLPTFWIPPGCRETLTRPDDAVRFTTHPVTKASRDSSGNPIPHDESGEVVEPQNEAAE